MKHTIVFGLLALFSAPALAGSGSTEFIPLQERAQGRSLTGASLLNDSLFSNPASASFTQVYSVDATFNSLKTFALSILDTKTSGIGGALGFYRMARPGFDKPVQGGRLSLSNRLSQNLGIGLTGKMIWGQDLTAARADRKYTDLDLGMLAQLDFLQLGLNVRNLFGGEELMGETREYSFGARVGWEQTLFLSASVGGNVSGFEPREVGFGAEYVSPYYFALKGGFRTRPIESNSFWSAGLSVLSPRVSLHYAVEIPNQPGSGAEHTFGTTVLF